MLLLSEMGLDQSPHRGDHFSWKGINKFKQSLVFIMFDCGTRANEISKCSGNVLLSKGVLGLYCEFTLNAKLLSIITKSYHLIWSATCVGCDRIWYSPCTLKMAHPYSCPN